MFPIDQVTIDYLRFTGRDDDHLALVEAYAKAQGLWHDPDAPEPVYSEHVSLDLGDVEPSLAGPARPQDRVALSVAGDAYRVALDRAPRTAATEPAAAPAPPDDGRRRGHRRHHQLHQHVEPAGHGRRRAGGQEGRRAGPALQALGQDLAGARLARRHRLPRAGRPDRAAAAARLLPRRLRLHHLHRQLRPAARRRDRCRQGRGPLGRLGALGQPELRGTHPPRCAVELSGVAAPRGGLRAGGDDRHRPHHHAHR